MQILELIELYTHIMARTTGGFLRPHAAYIQRPESIQVAQTMNRTDPVRIWNEPVQNYHSQMLGDDPNEPLGGRGSRTRLFAGVTRGSQSAPSSGLTLLSWTPETADAVKAHLTAVATHSMLYGVIKLNNEAESRRTVFGPDCVLWFVMEVFGSDTDQKKRLYGIQSLLVVVMQGHEHRGDI
jgi:hypothetical protein